ncbi:histidine phosphatase family protein, partial [Synechococcus moorigangaii CMS01]|nr:histidine phosphatase family protein [Synechococcus moorigangaii CMS01]
MRAVRALTASGFDAKLAVRRGVPPDGFLMPVTVRYLTHPQVLIEPLKDVRRWSLSPAGRERVAALTASLGSLSQTRRVISSDETKAVETAAPLALALGVGLEIRPRMHENDR